MPWGMAESKSLADRKPARGALDDGAVFTLLPEVPGWEVVRTEGKAARIKATFSFDDFGGAMGLAVRVGLIAEALDHHPDLHVSWGKLVVEVSTHDVKGLSEADFVLAARVNRAAGGAPGKK
jgi:4a-hydroxytetrahydrobiopterin dehydratase